jgi:hypothetical protein
MWDKLLNAEYEQNPSNRSGASEGTDGVTRTTFSHSEMAGNA